MTLDSELKKFKDSEYDTGEKEILLEHLDHLVISSLAIVFINLGLQVPRDLQKQFEATKNCTQTEARPAVCSTQPANVLHSLLCAIHTVSRFHSVALEAPVQLSGLPRVFVHALAFSSTPSNADAAEFSSTPSHAAAAARVLCSFHHSPRVLQLSDSCCSVAQRGSTALSRHGHQTTPR
jgi:hypothetical protein